MKKVVGLVIGLLPVSAGAECVPSPDCASIGYTETSCDGGSVKCPFDTSKLRCIPCDSSFRYSCDGENVVSAVGAACNNKYVTCNCVEGATLNNGECICDKSCKMGNIYYSDGTCSSCVDSNKTAVGVVVNDNELVVSLDIAGLKWAPEYVDVTSIEDIRDASIALADYNGLENTRLVTEFYGADGDVTTMAPVYCYNYAPSAMQSTLNKWYLPATGELYEYIYSNYATIRATGSRIGTSYPISWFWSSSEHSFGSGWRINIANGEASSYYKVSAHNVVCLMEI